MTLGSANECEFTFIYINMCMFLELYNLNVVTTKAINVTCTNQWIKMYMNKKQFKFQLKTCSYFHTNNIGVGINFNARLN